MKLEELTIKNNVNGEPSIRLTLDGEMFWIYKKEVKAIVRALIDMIGRELDIIYVIKRGNKEIEKILGIR